MTTIHTFPHPTTSEAPWWAYGLLGLLLAIGGLFLLGNIVAATLVTALFLGAAMLVSGIFQMIHAFWAKGWGGFFLSFLIGLLYAAGGAVLFAHPVAASLMLTLVLAVVLVASGIMRIVLAFRFWERWGWMLLLSGLIGILAGSIIISGWPATGLVVLGLCVGVDLIVHGIAWMTYGWTMRHQVPA